MSVRTSNTQIPSKPPHRAPRAAALHLPVPERFARERRSGICPHRRHVQQTAWPGSLLSGEGSARFHICRLSSPHTLSRPPFRAAVAASFPSFLSPGQKFEHMSHNICHCLFPEMNKVYCYAPNATAFFPRSMFSSCIDQPSASLSPFHRSIPCTLFKLIIN